MSSTAQLDIPKLAVGDKFASFEELTTFLTTYEQATKQKFWIRSSHKVGKVNVKRALSAKLEYYDLHYSCIHGGLKFKARGKGERQTSTLKMNCEAGMKFLASTCGQFLELKSIYLQHENHDLSSACTKPNYKAGQIFQSFLFLQNAFEHLPQNRKLAPCERAEVEALLNLGCNKKKLQNKITTDTSKHPTLKDLTNIQSALKRGDENDLAKAVNVLEAQYQATVSVLRNDDNNFKGLYFSTEDMRNSVSSWPEIVLIDGTYKLLAQDFTLMLLLVEDSNGLSEVAGVALIVHEDRETFEWFLGCFKRENQDACSKIKCFMADKDLLERDVLKEIFGVPVYICLFHTLKTFSRQITVERMGAPNPMKRQEILKHLQGLAYSSSDTDYNEKYEEFCAAVPEGILQYYNSNWHPIRQEWTVYSMAHGNLENLTNNRLESINNKIKQVVPKRSTLKSFIEYFFEWLSSHKYERDHKAAQHVLKRPVTIFAPGTCEYQYLTQLTSFAFRYVIDSIEKSQSINTEDIATGAADGAFTIKTSKGTVNTTLVDCQCSFWTSLRLPCKHIFAIRKYQELPKFDEGLSDVRWTKEYYLQTQRTFRQKTNLQTITNCPGPVVTGTMPQRPLTLTEKRKKTTLIASSLVTLASLSSKGQFLSKLQVLKDIERLWREGFEVTVKKIVMTDYSSNASSAPTDLEDDHISIVNNDRQPLQTISECSEDDFDIASLDSELVAKVLDWETEVDLQDLTDYLEASAHSQRTNSADMGGIITPPPETPDAGPSKIDTVAESRTKLTDADMLKEIIMPGPIRARGRPKGAVLTAIGLKRSRTVKTSKAPVEFKKKVPRINWKLY